MEEETEEMAQQRYVRRVRLIFFLSGIYFDHKHPVARFVHRLFAYMIVGLCWYTSLFILFHIFFHGKFSPIYSSYFIVFSWQLQSCIAMSFFLYWQHKGTLKHLCVQMQFSTPGVRNVARTITIVSILFMFSIILLTFAVTIMIRATGREGTFFNIQTVNAFIHPKFAPIMLLTGIFQSAALVLVISILAGQALFLRAELNHLNAKLEVFGESKADGLSLEQNLRVLFDEHVEVARRIRFVSGVFEKFNLALFITNIPLLVFTLFTLIVRARVAWIDAVLTSPEVILGFAKVIYLLYIPSKIQSAAAETCAVLCANARIWGRLDRRLFELGTVFVAHANQRDLGMNILGMMTISKPFLLTAASIITTALTFLVQSKFPCLAKRNATADFAH